MQRRTLLQAALGASALGFAGWGHAREIDHANSPRLLVVLLRGGMDGLTAVPPVGDPLFGTLRPNIAARQVLPLDGAFGLHPKLRNLHQAWAAGHLSVVHSTGFTYTGRSHFEGQDIMQTGQPKPYTSASGWVGRAMQVAGVSSGVSISIPMPLILRGNPETTTQFPNWMPRLPVSVANAMPQLWASDPLLAPYADVIRRENLDAQAGAMGGAQYQNARSLPELARLAAQEMREPLGPRVGLIDVTHGFDTHANQGADEGTHAERLADLDGLVGAFRTHMGDAWQRSLLLTVTEFGRTAAENGTAGTDHGVGTCAFLVGGLNTQSKVYADWRGLNKAQLFEGRDLPATIDLNAVHARVLERVFDLDVKRIQESVMPVRSSDKLQGLLGIG
jgi:uncharacterized protein (DUF1501 family)